MTDATIIVLLRHFLAASHKKECVDGMTYLVTFLVSVAATVVVWLICRFIDETMIAQMIQRRKSSKKQTAAPRRTAARSPNGDAMESYDSCL